MLKIVLWVIPQWNRLPVSYAFIFLLLVVILHDPYVESCQICCSIHQGIPHPRWDERPILVVAKRPNMTLTKQELLGFYQGKMARWQIPVDVVFVDSIPLGATGKILKKDVRATLRGMNYQLPDLVSKL